MPIQINISNIERKGYTSVSCVTLSQKRKQVSAKCSKSSFVCKSLNNSSDFLGICCSSKHSGTGYCISGRYGSTVESPEMSTEK